MAAFRVVGAITLEQPPEPHVTRTDTRVVGAPLVQLRFDGAHYMAFYLLLRCVPLLEDRSEDLNSSLLQGWSSHQTSGLTCLRRCF